MIILFYFRKYIKAVEMNPSEKPKFPFGKSKPKTMYNSDCSSSSSLSSNEVFLDSPDSGVNYPSLKSLENKLDLKDQSEQNDAYKSAQKLQKWSSNNLQASTPKNIPPGRKPSAIINHICDIFCPKFGWTDSDYSDFLVPKARKNIPGDAKKTCNGKNNDAQPIYQYENERCDNWSTNSSSKSSPLRNIMSTPKNIASDIYLDDASKFFTPYGNLKSISHDSNFNHLKKPPDKPVRRQKKRMSIDGEDLIEVEKLEQVRVGSFN